MVRRGNVGDLIPERGRPRPHWPRTSTSGERLVASGHGRLFPEQGYPRSGLAHVLWACYLPVIFLFVLVAFSATACAGDARLELPSPLIPGVEMDGRVVVDNAGARMRRIVLPQVEGIEWQVQNQTATQTSIINGAITSSESIALTVRVARVGTFQIPPATIHLSDNSTLATTPLTVTAKEGDATLSGEASAEAYFEPDTIVPGQPTTLSLRLRLLQGQIRALGINPPAQAISLGERTIQEGQVNDAQGRRWVEVTVAWPLTFSQPDTITVSGQQPYEITVGNGIFNSRTVRRQIPVKPASLTVTALPSDGRPADFTGLIGTVAVSAALDRNRIATGEGAQLSVTYRGRGVELLGRPTLPTIANTAIYPKDDDKAAATVGERSFRWDVVPAQAGNINIPPFSVPFFDPASLSYRRATSEPLMLNVIPGRARPLEVAGNLLVPSTPALATAPTVVLTGLAALPSPLRGSGRRAVSWQWSLSLWAGALGFGLCLGIIQRWMGRLPRGPHRGRALAEALTAGDLERITAALHHITPALNANERATAQRVQAAVDLARFGGQPLTAEIVALAKKWEGVA